MNIFAHSGSRALTALGLLLALGASEGAFAATTAPTGAGTAAPAMTALVPAYFDTSNTAAWTALTTSAAQIPTTVILNPNSGPGKRVMPGFTLAVAKLHAVHGKVIGYVPTSYAKRALSAVIADINAYTSLYQVDGFFIDEMTNDAVTAHVQYYQSIYNYIKGLKSTYTVTANPGATFPELYASLPTADQFVVFENSAKAYASFRPDTWQANYPRSRFVHIVYAASATQLPTVLDYALSHGAGAVFVTSAGLPNPYGVLPAYWTTEVSGLLARTTALATGR